MHSDAHVAEHANDVLDLLGVHQIIRKMIVDFGKSQITLFFFLLKSKISAGHADLRSYGVSTLGAEGG